MRKLFFLFVIFFLVVSTIKSQTGERHKRESKPLQKIEQWVEVKLIEVLNLDEETAVRFFARRNEFQKKMKEILDQKDRVIQNIEDEIRSGSQTSDAAYKEQIGNILSLESRITKERENFLKSLSDLFTTQQIAKLVVFESKFRKEIRERLIERGRGRFKE